MRVERSPRWWVVRLVAVIVALVGLTGGALVVGLHPAGTTPGSASTSRSATATASATTAPLAQTVALPTYAGDEVGSDCLRDTGYWVVEGSASGPWTTWAEGIAGPEMELVWPPGYRARFTPLLEVLAPDGTVVAREGTPMTSACELAPTQVYPADLLPPHPAPTPVAGLPLRTPTPPELVGQSAVLALESGFTIDGSASAGVVGAAPDGTGGSVVVAVSPGATTRTVAKVPAAHVIHQVLLSADWVAWVEQWYGETASAGGDHAAAAAVLVNTPGCLNVGQPLEWQIVAARLSGGSPTVVAHGTNTRGTGECDLIPDPTVALSGDRVAWTVEVSRPGHPDAIGLVVSSLATSRTMREITMPATEYIDQLSLDGQALAFRAASADMASAVVWFSRDDATAPTLIPTAATAAVGGGRLAWAPAQADGVVSVTPEDALGAATTLAPPVDLGFTLQVPTTIVLDRSLVAWEALGQFGDVYTSRIVVWRAGWPSPRLLDEYSQPDMIQLADGWLAWDSTLDWMGGPAEGSYRTPETVLP